MIRALFVLSRTEPDFDRCNLSTDCFNPLEIAYSLKITINIKGKNCSLAGLLQAITSLSYFVRMDTKEAPGMTLVHKVGRLIKWLLISYFAKIKQN
jgi:hypothetical protein